MFLRLFQKTHLFLSSDVGFLIFDSEKEEIRLESGECEVGEVVRNMKAEERALLGFMCKEIIDAGRLMWLKEQLGLQAEIVNYVPQCISPENHLLIATRK